MSHIFNDFAIEINGGFECYEGSNTCLQYKWPVQ